MVEYRTISGWLILPNPSFGDTEKALNRMNVGRTITGDTFSYIKTNPNKLLSYEFSISRKDYHLLKAFYINNIGIVTELTNWKGEKWMGWIVNDVLSTVENRKHDNVVTIDFEGRRLI